MDCILASADTFAEPKAEIIRRHCSTLTSAEVARLTRRQAVATLNSLGSHRLHDCVPEGCGYLLYFDTERERAIYVAEKAVGMSSTFHHDKQITSVFNVMEPVNLHINFEHMDPREKTWQLNNLKHVAIQMCDTEGNIALFCNHGRSRSPMYLVVYLIIFYDYSVSDARSTIADMLHLQRGLELDRYNSLTLAAELIHDLK